MEKVYCERSLFLCQHQALQEFAQLFFDSFKKDPKIQWSVVCERKEDLITIRHQIFFEIQKLFAHTHHTLFSTTPISSVLGGISMYTLDKLAQNFAATLASSPPQSLQDLPDFIQKPYLDIVQQEYLVETALSFYGYLGNDALPLAKQILCFLDLTWPEDFDFAKLLMSTQHKNQQRPVQEITEISLRQILACFHYSKSEFSHYCRLQSFVKDYLQASFQDHLFEHEKGFVFPRKFLQGHILWVSALEFLPQSFSQHSQEEKILTQRTIKPGHFQSSFVDEFQTAVKKARKILGTPNTLFLHSRTLITEGSDNVSIPNDHFCYLIAQNDFSYLEKFTKTSQDQDTLYLLGDCDPKNLTTLRPKGSGSYPVNKKQLEAWNTQNGENFPHAKEIFEQLDSFFESFLEKISLINHDELFIDIGKLYGLQPKMKQDDFLIPLFYKFLETKSLQLGQEEMNCTKDFSKVLFFIASARLPQKIEVMGRPHAPTGNSFQVKVLNNALFLLKKQGVCVDLPASEIMYKGFWKNMLNQNIQTEFYLQNTTEFQNIPKDLFTKNPTRTFGKPFSSPQESLLHSHLSKRIQFFSEQKEFLLPHWQKTFGMRQQKIAITSFERYIHCPLQFFLNDLLGVTEKVLKNFSVDPSAVGIGIHLILEQLLTRLVTGLGNEEYTLVMEPVFAELILKLSEEKIFLSQNPKDWEYCVETTLQNTKTPEAEKIKEAFFEAIANIWQQKDEKSFFQQLQKRELIKRLFLGFLRIEHHNTKKNLQKKDPYFTGKERERPVSLTLEGLTFYGKIDRIDLSKRGFHIIDYKSSAFSKKEHELTLLPCEVGKNSQAKLSAQGGLYSLAWAQNNLEEDVLSPQVDAFSIYALKKTSANQHAVFTYTFQEPLRKDTPLYEKFLTQYGVYAKNLKKGSFFPRPLHHTVCALCLYQEICPVPTDTPFL